MALQDAAKQCSEDPGSAATHRRDVCAKHSAHELRLFCKTCNLPVCIVGAVEDHFGHQIELVTTTAARVSAAASTEIDQALRLKVRLIDVIHQVENLEEALTDTILGEQKRIRSHFSHLSNLLKDRELLLLHDLSAEEVRAKARLKQELLRLEAAAMSVDSALERARRATTANNSLDILRASIGMMTDVSSMAARSTNAELGTKPSLSLISFEYQQPAEVPLETILARHGRITRAEMHQSSLKRLLTALCRLAWLCLRYCVMALRNRCMPDQGE